MHHHVVPELEHITYDPGHTHNVTPHPHLATDAGHIHGVTGTLSAADPGHDHESKKPDRAIMVPIERVA